MLHLSAARTAAQEQLAGRDTVPEELLVGVGERGDHLGHVMYSRVDQLAVASLPDAS
jgi:hypothetical protein